MLHIRQVREIHNEVQNDFQYVSFGSNILSTVIDVLIMFQKLDIRSF